MKAYVARRSYGGNGDDSNWSRDCDNHCYRRKEAIQSAHFYAEQGFSMRIVQVSLDGFVVLLFCLFAMPVKLRGQDTEWNRSINAGEAAMADHKYADAEVAYREALALAEKRWKKDARISASLLKLAEAC